MDKELARTIYKEVNSHMSIRYQERNLAVNSLENQKYTWVVTKFGLGEDEFIGSVLSEVGINPGNCFSINCDEVSSLEELIETFKATFSHDITKFFDGINSLDRPLLVFNKLNEELVKDLGGLKEFIQTVFDFSPNLKIAIVSEFKPDRRFFASVELFALDIPAVKQFIEKSQEYDSSFTFMELEKVHRISSGIPFYIDKVIEQLKFRPLSDLGDMEFEASSNDTNSLPKSVKKKLKFLHSDESKQSCRRFILLSILSLLHNGETYERIRRFVPTKPFHPEDISYLLKNKLIITVQVNSIFEENQKDSELVKIIRVPRVIRDYITSLLSDEEKIDIYKQACDLYLGNNWRNSIKIIKPKDAELDLVIHQNLQVIIRFLLSNGIEQNNEVEVTRLTRVSMSLIEYFSEKGAYKDAFTLTEETLLLINDVKFEGFGTPRTYLMKKMGENLRMTSFHDKSISILKSICDDEENSLSNGDRNDIRLSISYAYETLDNEEEAVRYAKLIKQYEKDKNSANYLAAESVIANFISDDSEKIRKLNTLRNRAEKLGFSTLKANVVLDICHATNDVNQIKQLDQIILDTKNGTYNKVRALAAKADIILNTKSIDEITNEDLLGLHVSYSYSFYQRLQTILNNCHRLAWGYWSKQSRFDQLLNLFRYSSFVWRLCGASEQEKKYIDELHSMPEFIDWRKSNKHGINITYYEQRIFAVYNSGKSNNIIELPAKIEQT